MGKEKVIVKELEEGLVELSFTAPGETDEEHLEMALETLRCYEEQKAKLGGGGMKVLIDLSNAGAPHEQPMKIYIDMLKDDTIEQVAFFGLGGIILKEVVDFIVSAAGKDDKVRFFVEKEPALAWLKE